MRSVKSCEITWCGVRRVVDGLVYVIAYILNVFDAIATWFWCQRYGIVIEANPIGRWLIRTGLMWSVKLVIVALLLMFLYKHRRNAASVIGVHVVLFVYAWIALRHISLFLSTL